MPAFIELNCARGVRYLEIDILERDGKVDADAARKLRDNADAHLRFDAPLEPLPA